MKYDGKFATLLNQHLGTEDRSIGWLARRMNINYATVWRWANTQTLPRDRETVMRLVDELGIRDKAARQALVNAAGYVYEVGEALLDVEKIQRHKDQIHDESYVQTDYPHPMMNMLHRALLQMMHQVPAQLAVPIFDIFELYERGLTSPNYQLYPSTCGDQGIDLAHRRLFISSAFGTYFAGLLERNESHIAIAEQVDSPVIFGRADLSPLERILWAIGHPQGPQIVVFAAEAGMGKSTLAAKVIRCLYEQKAIDVILGDSAKSQRVDPISGDVIPIDPEFYDAATCYNRLYAQLGLHHHQKRLSQNRILGIIKDRLIGRRAVIVLDNLDTIKKSSELLTFLRSLASRDVRIIVTTRKVDESIRSLTYKTMVVALKPVSTLESCRRFLRWHVTHFQEESPDLRGLEIEGVGDDRISALMKRTGGIPLLLQLVISTVARSSWGYVDQLPTLFGTKLLNFLYSERWQELEESGVAGRLAKSILQLVAHSQYHGETVTFQVIAGWAEKEEKVDYLQSALRLLHDRFLIVNQDSELGNFTIFPSLVEFLGRTELATL